MDRRIRGRLRVGIGAALAVVLFSGCASLRLLGGPRVGPCPGPITPTESIRGDFTLRQSARITAPGLDLAFRLVTEKRGDGLRVMGFGALGAKRFFVSQRGIAVRSERFGPPLAVPPENILRDLHRIHFASGDRQEPSQGAPPTVVSTRTEDGQPVARIENPACGYDATYVTLSRESLR